MTMLKHKYGAKASYSEGIRFPSKLERDCFLYLKVLEKEGTIRLVLRQVGIDLPGGVRHHVDFLVFTRCGGCAFLEAKGRDLEAGRVRRKVAEGVLGVTIGVVKRPGEVVGVLRELGAL